MTTYVNVFGSATVPPSGQQYNAISMAVSTTLVWPQLANSNVVASAILDISATVGALNLTLPSAAQVSPGQDVLIRNTGANAFTLLDAGGNNLGSIPAGTVKYCYLTDVSTIAGVWAVFTFGTGTSAADALTLYGNGLSVSGTGKLQSSWSIATGSSNYSVALTDRAKVFALTNASVTYTLPAVGSAGNGFWVGFKNEASGTLTISPTSPDTIDGQATMALAPGESCFVVTDGSSWYSIGYGRSTSFQFTKFIKDITGAAGAYTMTTQDASNKLLQFIGTPTANWTITVPSVVGIYYVQTTYTGSYTLTIKTAAGTGVTIPTNSQSIMYCDGVNVVQAQTATVSSTVQLVDGTAAAPSLTFANEVTTGLYRSGLHVMSVTVNGVSVGSFTSTGLDGTVIGGTTPAAGAFTNLSSSGTVSGTGFSNYLASPPAIGGTAAAAGTFTALTASASTSFPTPTAGDNSTKGATTAFVQTALVNNGKNQYRVLNLLHPNNAYSVFKAGWRPAMFAQNTGIAANVPFILTDGATGVTSEVWAMTGNVKDDTVAAVGAAAGNVYETQGFKVPENVTSPTITLKLTKTGNPTDNTVVGIWSDNGSGSPSALLGTTATLSNKLVTSSPNGAEYTFTPAPGALTAGTQYHIVVTRSGAVDAANYVSVKATASRTYPHGFLNNGTSVPAWTQATGYALCFKVLAPASNALIQSGGQFGNGKLVFAEGAPLDQSRGLIAKLSDLDFTPDEFTIRLNGAAFTKDKTILDLLYGLDHDRAVLRCNVTTGYLQFDVYDSTGTKRTVTGTTDVSTGTNHDVVLHVRAKGDGADKVEMLVDGVAATPVTAATFTFARELQLLGHVWLGGGFNLAPTWTTGSISSFTGLPSTLGWTYNGTGTEANQFSASGGKLYQNKNGFAATDYAGYTKTSAGFSNVNGLGLCIKGRVSSGTNTKDSQAVIFVAFDGTKAHGRLIQEFFTQAYQVGTAILPPAQLDAKLYESVYLHIGKGADTFLFVNGRLVDDGTNLQIGTTALNQILVGDNSTASGENADAVYSYWKYYNTAAILPQFTSGSISEFALFSGDQTGIASSLWNTGTPISVKQFAGVGKDWVKEVSWVEVRSGITASPTFTSVATVPEMECYVIGERLSAVAQSTASVSAVAAGVAANYIDGALLQQSLSEGTSPTAGYVFETICNSDSIVNFGLHRVDNREYATAGTGSQGGINRNMRVEAK